MHYWGGKHYIAKKLSSFILPYAMGRRIVEPFCGALNLTQYLLPAIANDANKNIIDMYIQWRAGWRPEPITKDEYKTIIAIDSFERGFYGVGCSFSGKWCDSFTGDATGYVKHNGRDVTYFELAKNGLERKIRRINNYTKFTSGSYDLIELQHGDVVYCDPPYNNTACAYSDKFDSNKFWQWVMDNSDKCLFFVSEFSAPDGVKTVWSQETITWTSNNRKNTTEKLFMTGLH